ncbi:ribonuclease H-like domain-containing protein [Tanacetum coccineum]
MLLGSACWVWKAKNSSASNTFKATNRGEQGKRVIDSGCTLKAHVLDNKCSFNEYEDYEGAVLFLGVVLLRVPRKDNIYSVDLKSVVPTKGLTCLFAKATIDESNLWHRRLGHINFKNMNKLVRENLVRGLPSKIFENDHSCVAYPQQNGVAERRNRTLIEAARTMLVDSKLPTTFWAEAVNTACYVLNREIKIYGMQGPKDSEEDSGMKPTEVDESEASDKDGEDDQAIRSEFERLLQQEKQTVHPNSTNSINTVSTHVSAAGPSFTNDDPSSPVNAAEAEGTINKTLFIKKDKGDILLVQVYVDDIIFGKSKKSLCDEFCRRRMESSLARQICLLKILKKFNFATVKTTITPMEPNKALVKDEEVDSVDVHLYRSMIGSLMYLTASRPDIMFVVCACASVMLGKLAVTRGNPQQEVVNFLARDKKELAIPGQTTTGKEFSNPLMAGSLPKTISTKVSTASLT